MLTRYLCTHTHKTTRLACQIQNIINIRRNFHSSSTIQSNSEILTQRNTNQNLGSENAQPQITSTPETLSTTIQQSEQSNNSSNNQEPTSMEEELQRIKELESELYAGKQAMSMIFRASGSSFGFKKRRDEDETPTSNVPVLTPEEQAKAKLLAYKLASLALMYGTLINIVGAVVFIAMLYFIFDIKTTKEFKDVIIKFIRGEEALKQHKELESKELSSDEGMLKLKDLFDKTRSSKGESQ
ncbi:hypothetical protein C9374_004249 [Naegleria lovaniensis]|uniref:Transmembrane protein n=1 Tax=Naegleria lovaniensis TaxID=51637 RepID=A0AA88GSY4_NAELO|nr:uncharacterized protein C9374_004249 [Naegleria lovaniensis]KAG2383578.1 hypothetical protein C9374_004249 [Naegleria lovaniensis]